MKTLEAAVEACYLSHINAPPIATMMGWKTLRRPQRRLRGYRKKDNIARKGVSDLFDRIWGLDIGSDVSESAPYLQHYELVHTMIDGSFISFPDRQSVMDLLDKVKLFHYLPLRQIKENLKATNPTWMVAQDSDKAASRAVEFCVQLWLMVQPSPGMHLEGLRTVKEIVTQSLETISTTPPFPMKTSPRERLSPDFKAKNLIRIGGIDVIWTSFLSEHLQIVRGNQLKVFGHVSLLRKYAKSSEGYVKFIS